MNQAMRPSTHALHGEAPPQLSDPDGSRHWITRAANFTLVVSEARAGARFERADNPDEYMVLAPARARALIEARGERVLAGPESLTIVPPGASSVTMEADGPLVRVFSNRAGDVAAQAGNAATYADGAPEVAPIAPWPEPVGGFRLRHYAMRDYASPDPTPLKMRVFRSTNLMINIFEKWPRRRDETKLSPHSHDDFEQISLALEGSFVHHLRYPWGPDKTQWRADEHVRHASPSALVIPARVLHTSQDVGEGATWLVDIFASPRLDFSERSGFVLNAHDYPMPEQAGATTGERHAG